MEKLKRAGSGVIGALCELVVGILLLVDPVSFASGIIMTIGIIFVVIGVWNIISYFRSAPQYGIIERKLSIGLLAVAGGLFCIFNPQWFIATFPILTMVYGLASLVSGVFKVEATVNMIRLGLDHWIWPAIGAALTLVCAVFILCNPLSTTAALWLFIGISLIVEAVFDFVAAFIPSKND